MNLEISLIWFAFHLRILWKHMIGGNFFHRVLFSLKVQFLGFGFRIGLADWEVITAEYNTMGVSNKPIKPEMVEIKLIEFCFQFPGHQCLFQTKKSLGVRGRKGTKIKYHCDFTKKGKGGYFTASWDSKVRGVLDIRRYNFHQTRRFSLRPFFPVFGNGYDYRRK